MSCGNNLLEGVVGGRGGEKKYLPRSSWQDRRKLTIVLRLRLESLRDTSC
jgi:hypothetical protein